MWLHVTATWEQRLKLAKIFVNGTIAARKVAADGLSSYVLKNNAHSFYQIGKKEDTGETFYGLVTKLKVLKKVLSSQDIATEMSGMLSRFRYYLRGLRVVSLTECSKRFKTKIFRF